MKIVTTVGTSLVTNVINPLRNKCNLSDDEKKALENFSKLQIKDYKNKKSLEKEYQELKDFIKSKVIFDSKTSAEIKSLISIKNSPKFKKFSIEIELIATDSILSPMCSEILKDMIEKYSDFKANFDDKNIIEDLQVADYKRYKKGLINLLNRLNQIGSNGEYFGDMVLNVTGGFKGVIPYMTIFGQVNKIPIFYIFEFTDALIEIPQMPLNIDKNIFEESWQSFYELDKEEIIKKNRFSYDFIRNNENLLEIEDGLISLNPLGKILWDSYKRDNFIFYTTDEIFAEINRQKEIKRILSSKFLNSYKEKTEQKNNHFVYDDGNNPNRIFYFEDNGNIYIYKTFENHDKYEKYLNDKNNQIDKEEFVKKSKLFKIIKD